MFYKTLAMGSNRNVIEYDQPFQSLLVKGTTIEGTPDNFSNILVTIEIKDKDNKRLDIARKIPINEYGLITSQDGFGFNSYNIDEKPNVTATKGYTHWRALNLTPKGNIDLREDEKVIITFEDAELWDLEICIVERTFTTDEFITITKSTVDSGTNINHSVNRAHAFLMEADLYTSDITYKYADNSSVVVSPSENKFLAYTTDYTNIMEVVNGEQYTSNRTIPSGYFVKNLTGVNPINSIRFDNLGQKVDMIQVIMQVRQGDVLQSLPKTI